MKKRATRKDAYNLVLKSGRTLVDMQQRGIAVDVDYYNKKKIEVASSMLDISKELKETKEIKLWKKVYGKKFNMNSGDQLADILFNKLGHEATIFTEGTKDSLNPKPATTEKHLATLDIPMVDKLIKISKFKHTLDKIKEILREEVNSLIHPSVGLNLALTYRSQCSNPQFHNMSVRDKEQSKIVRSGVIPRPGNQLMEIDCKANEVKASTCYHKDPVMIEYLIDETKDMHRDTAMDCYMLKRKQVSKDIRYCGKNKFVFPEFYGSYWGECAKELWTSIPLMKLKTKDKGISLKKHLRSKEIKNLFQFEEHIKEVEDKFWNERFKVYRDWKEEIYISYLETGCIEMLTGFRCYELMKKNEAINRAIQGTAFHWLLWCLIELNKEIKKQKMKSLIIFQIHDSILIDAVPEEIDDIIEMAKEIMRERIRKHWDWIIVPLDIEVEVTPIDGNWFQKKEIKI